MTLAERVGQAASAWVPTFEAVPREWFVPDVVWRPNPAGRGWVSVERTIEPQRWAERVAADDLRGHPGRRRAPCPARWCRPGSDQFDVDVMAVMLEALSIDPDHRVLEIGTATGWNAALLAAMVGGHKRDHRGDRPRAGPARP